MSRINIVLYHPEIPLNTANIMRTCVGTDTTLHLIKPLGFDLDKSEKVFNRGSSNYAHLVEMRVYENWEEFVTKHPTTDSYCFITRYGLDIYPNINAPQLIGNNQQMYLIFGAESCGIDKEILDQYKDQTYRLPTSANVRSLNLGNCVMTVLYEILRQVNFEDLEFKEPHKINYLKED